MNNLPQESMDPAPLPEIDENTPDPNPTLRKYSIKNIFFRIFFAATIFSFGLGSGFLLWGKNENNQNSSGDLTALINEINPPDGYEIQAIFGDVGPKLIAAGAIEPKSFELVYQQAGRPLSEKEMSILVNSTQDKVVINQHNSYFLLNFFWALGLTNKNPILDEGVIQEASGGKIEQFASTGGWTIGQKPVTELFSSATIIELTDEQQSRVEQVAAQVYRPCCNNPTIFPDCNHGMAMLGLLELMASQNASVNDMFTAAKYINAFWFPQQTLEQGIFLKHAKELDYKDVDASVIVGKDYSSISGFSLVHQWLLENGQLGQAPQSGNSCGV